VLEEVWDDLSRKPLLVADDERQSVVGPGIKSKQASKRANEQNEQSKWYTAKHEDKLTHQDDISGSHVDIIVNAFCAYGVVRYKFVFFGEV
jgi:hypothetical protein